MKRILSIAVMLVAVAMLTGCGMHKVPVGNVGVKFNNYGESKGVDEEVVGPGYYFLSLNENIVDFPTFMQNYNWTQSVQEGRPVDESIAFQTKEGVIVQTDIGISFSIPKHNVAKVYQKYRKGVDEITDIYLRNMVRDAMVKYGAEYTVEDLYSGKKAEFMAKITTDVMSRAPDFIIDKIFLLNTFRVPESISKSINDKIAATQRAQQRENELREADAQALKDVAEARGKAEANAALTKTLTPLILQEMAIQKWDGKLPQAIGAGSSVPFINIGTK